MKTHLRTPLSKGTRNTEREMPRESSGRAGVGESLYRCPRCLRNYLRKSDKAWLKSHCVRTGQNTHIIRLTNAEGMAAGADGPCMPRD